MKAKQRNIIYASGVASQNILYNFMSMYIMFFFTDLLHIDAKAATFIIVAASIWDAVNDLMMGALVDNTKTKIGKFRPYILSGAVFIFLTTVLCFTFFNTKANVTVLISGAAYILWGMSYTVVDIPLWALSSSISNDKEEKNQMITMGKIGGTLGVVICVLLSIKVLDLFGGTSSIKAFTYTSILVGFIAFIGILLIGLFIKEGNVKISRVKLKDNIKVVTKNKVLINLLLCLFVINTIAGIRQAAQIYFTIYTWGSESYVTLLGAALVVGMVIGMAASPYLIKKYEKKLIMIYSSLFGAVVNFVPYININSAPLGLVSICFSFASLGVLSITSMAMLLDAIDYSEYLFGFRSEGIVFSLNTFATKLSAAFARLILGLTLVLINYESGQAISKTTVSAFSALMYLIPSLACILTIVILYKYKLDRNTMASVEEKLKRN